MLGILGYAIYTTINSSDSSSPILASVWIICFALAAGAMWEIWEYATDGIFGLNSQEFLISSGTFYSTTPLQGRAALKDTMEDLILDFVGSTIIAVAAFFDVKRIQHQQSENDVS